jgi:transposase, IS5 family
MDVSRKASFGGVKFQRACSLTYCLWLQAFHPAGPDGIRRRGSGLVHSVATTAANAHNVTQVHAFLYGKETDVFSDSGYRGVEKREEIQAQHPDVNWHIAMMPGKRKALDKDTPMGAILEKLEQTKASIRAKVEHPFRVIKRQFGYVKVKYRGLAKNTANLVTLFALSNLWMVRKRLLNMGAQG